MQKHELAVPLPSQVVHHLPESRTRIQLIRDEIRKIIVDDDKAAAEIFKYAFSPGKAGNRQMDQAVVAERLFHHDDVDGSRTILASYEGLTHKELYHHFSVVMNRLGYVSQGGYFQRHAIANENGVDEERAETA